MPAHPQTLLSSLLSLTIWKDITTDSCFTEKVSLFSLTLKEKIVVVTKVFKTILVIDFFNIQFFHFKAVKKQLELFQSFYQLEKTRGPALKKGFGVNRKLK